MNISGIDKVGITENRESYDIAFSTPTQVTLEAFEGNLSWGCGTYKTHRLNIELKEGYTIRLEITEGLYNTLSETKIEENSN